MTAEDRSFPQTSRWNAVRCCPCVDADGWDSWTDMNFLYYSELTRIDSMTRIYLNCESKLSNSTIAWVSPRYSTGGRSPICVRLCITGSNYVAAPFYASRNHPQTERSMFPSAVSKNTHRSQKLEQESPALADKPARRLRKVCTVYVRAVGL